MTAYPEIFALNQFSAAQTRGRHRMKCTLEQHASERLLGDCRVSQQVFHDENQIRTVLELQFLVLRKIKKKNRIETCKGTYIMMFFLNVPSLDNVLIRSCTRVLHRRTLRTACSLDVFSWFDTLSNRCSATEAIDKLLCDISETRHSLCSERLLNTPTLKFKIPVITC